MDFGQALKYIKLGYRLAREGWNGKRMYVVLQNGYPEGVPINANTASAINVPEGTVCRFRPYLLIRTADPELTFVPWVASQSDLLAEDWMVQTEQDPAEPVDTIG